MSKGTVLITGASGGIGLDLARLFAEGGHDLVLVARSEGKLRELAAELVAKHGVKATVMPADLARPEAPDELARQLRSDGITVDILVNNAGYGMFGPFVEADARTELEMIQVNIVALTSLTKLLLPEMVERKTGRILNVASTAAFQPGPLMAVYYATKAYVLSFTEALANELRGTGVTATALCPGPTSTGFQALARMEDSKMVRGKKIMTSQAVARVGYAGMMKGKAVIVPGFKNKLLATSVRFAPRAMVTSLVRSLQERT
jgi:uncharacterized protein